MPEDLHVVRMSVKDFKRIRAVELRPPESGVMVVAGRNAQGKSSVLDALLAAFGGKRLCPPQPVRNGAERAEIVVDLGDLEVLRVFAIDGSTRVRVRAKDGAEFPSPQAMLDSLTGPFMDPLEFLRRPPADQRKQLLELLDLSGFDVAKSEAREAGAKVDRAQFARDLKKVEAERDGIGLPADLTLHPPDVAAVVKRLEEVVAEAGRFEAARLAAHKATEDAARKREAVGGVRVQADRRVEDARSALARAERDRDDVVAGAEKAALAAAERAVALQRELDGAQAPDVDAARKAVDAARAIEEQVRRRDRWRALDQQAESLESQLSDVGRRIEGERAARTEALKRAGLPVQGLEVVDDGLLYQGAPFGQASQSEKIKVVLALAMHKTPRLKVLRTAEGAFLDQESLAQVHAAAKAKGWLIVLERPDPTGADLVIEDGAEVAKEVAKEGVAP